MTFYEHKIISIDQLIPYVKNSRTHSEEQIEQLIKSINEFGFTNPVLIDENNNLIAGHARLYAAKKMGITNIPCIILIGLTETQKQAYIIADNKLALNATWDVDTLFEEIYSLQEQGYNIDFSGFTLEELETLRPQTLTEGLCDPDHIPDVIEEPKTKLGDVYILGNHRLMCGDSIHLDQVEKLMNDDKADMVFTDPPYGINIVSVNKKIGGDKSFGSIGGGKIIKSNIYEPIINDDTIQTAVDSYNLCISLNIKILIFWGGNYYASHLPDSSCWIVWDKNNTGNFADAELAWTNQKTAVRIFKHTWNGLIKESERRESRIHPTQKPIALAEWCFNEYGNKSKNILDLFGGSGSTLIACEKTNRKCYMMEISPHYCDVIVARWEKFTGKKAHLENGCD